MSKKIKDAGKVKCRICGKRCGRKGFSVHLKSHGIIFYDYVCKYLEDFPMWHPCVICGKIIKGVTCSKECVKKYYSNIRKGNIPWNKGLTKETDPTMKKVSETIKKYIKENGHNQTGLKRSTETRERQSNIRIEKGLSKGENNGMYGRGHTPEAIKKIFNNCPMNKLEQSIAEFLDQQNIQYYFQFFITKNDICKSYDFKIKHKPLIIEADGDYWHGGPGSNKYHNDVEQTKKNDIIKEKLAKERGYELYRFWESVYKKDKEKIFNEILNFVGE